MLSPGSTGGRLQGKYWELDMKNSYGNAISEPFHKHIKQEWVRLPDFFSPILPENQKRDGNILRYLILSNDLGYIYRANDPF